jgi:leucyl-tRNA synthetase
MKIYHHRKIEKKWQNYWAKNGFYQTKDQVKGKKNFYSLVEFPYPSGNLHIGHWYAFAVPDIFARFQRMRGFNVLFPIGFDAFGLPAENAAIKRGLNPRKWTIKNIAYMERQLRSMGASFDWSRRLITSDPDYYKWTQWLFLQFFRRGLAYKKKAAVNWCPSCQTVLANEQAAGGRCERCASTVTQKELSQWFLRITAYAERLLQDLEKLNWPEPIKGAQRNWIGKSEGAEIPFSLVSDREQLGNSITSAAVYRLKVFTTRPDTLFGATYLVVAPELADREFTSPNFSLRTEIQNWPEIDKYIKQTQNKTALERSLEKREKTGVEVKGIKAVNPINGERLSIWLADYVLPDYGTGAVMAVPAHDSRDWEFAKKFNLPVKIVIVDGKASDSNYTSAYTGDGRLINSGQFSGWENNRAKKEITKFAGGEWVTKYKLRDWLVSRQRYWGCPIPIVYDPQGRPHPVPVKYLPWCLPIDRVDFTPKGKSPLESSKEFKRRTEKIFGKGWTPEYDTLDTFVDSSWYFNRYTDPKNSKKFAELKKMKNWLPVDCYSGGAEHTTMHLLYARFFHKALFDMGLVGEPEPFLVRMNRGLILGPDGQKMSKSRGNVVDPDEWVKRVGADTVRLYLAFIGPYNEVGHYPWDLGGIAGIRRFLDRVWKIGSEVSVKLRNLTNRKRRLPNNLSVEKLESITQHQELKIFFHRTIKKVTEDIESFKFNTAISAIMILVNMLEKNRPVAAADYKILLRLLAPFAPHLTEEIWHALGERDSIHKAEWPIFDESLIKSATVKIVVQINNRVRASFFAPADLAEAEARRIALNLPETARWIGDKKIVKTFYVPGRLINFVLS